MFTDKDAGAHQSLFYLCGFLCLISLFSASSSLLLSNCSPEIRLNLLAHFERDEHFLSGYHGVHRRIVGNRAHSYKAKKQKTGLSLPLVFTDNLPQNVEQK